MKTNVFLNFTQKSICIHTIVCTWKKSYAILTKNKRNSVKKRSLNVNSIYIVTGSRNFGPFATQKTLNSLPKPLIRMFIAVDV